MADPRDFLFNSDYDTDKVIGVIQSSDVGTVSLAAGASITMEYPNPVEDTAFYVGNFWIDGVDTKVPLDQYLMTNDDYTDVSTVLTTSVRVRVLSLGNDAASILFTNNSAGSVVINFTMLLIAKTDQAPITETANNLFNYDTSKNYFKIAIDDTYDIPSIGVAGADGINKSTITIPHDLTYAPFFLGSVEYSDDISQGYLGTDPAIRVTPYIDDDNLYLEILNHSSSNPSYAGTYHYRVYYDD